MRPGSAVSSLLEEGGSLISALPAQDSEEILKALLSSETPLALALRHRISGSIVNDPQGLNEAAVRASSPITQIIREADVLLSALPEAVAQSIALAIHEGDNALAVELRRRAVQNASAASNEREQMLGSPGLSFLLREGEKLIHSLTEETSASVVSAVLEGESVIASQLRQRMFGPEARNGLAASPASGAAPRPTESLQTPVAAARSPAHEAVGGEVRKTQMDKRDPVQRADGVVGKGAGVGSGEGDLHRSSSSNNTAAPEPSPSAPAPAAAAAPSPAPALAAAAAAPSNGGAGAAAPDGGGGGGGRRSRLAALRAELGGGGEKRGEAAREADAPAPHAKPAAVTEEDTADQMPALMSEARKLLRTLPDALALEVVAAVAQQDSPLAVVLRQSIRSEDEASGVRDMEQLIQSSEELVCSLPEEAAILLVAAVLEGASPLASSLRLQLQLRPRSGDSARSAAHSSRPSSSASNKSGKSLSAFEELLRDGKELLSKLPDPLACSVLDAAMSGESALSAAIRTAQAPDLDAGHVRPHAQRVWSLKHNRCTRLGLQPTLGLVEEGKPEVKGVLLDLFGEITDKDADCIPVVKLDEEQATQLTLRMEASGKGFRVLPFTWERLDDCEQIAGLRQLSHGGGEEVLVPVTTAQGEINAGEWAYFEVDVDESWNAMEIGCEASAGFIIIQKGGRPDDTSFDQESETALLKLREDWRKEEDSVARCHQAGDNHAAMLHLRNATALYKQIEKDMVTRTKCMRQTFPTHGSLVHLTVVSNPSSEPKERPTQTVQRPFLLAGEVFPGKWHIALKCTSDPRHPMRYRMSLRYTTKTHLQTEKAIRITHLEPKNNGEDERRQEEQAREKIQNSDLKSLEKLKWEKWNKVDLAKALGPKFVGTFYPPKLEGASVIMQKIVRGYLARRRKRWLGQVQERRKALKAKEEQVKASLSLEDKNLLTSFKSKYIPQELDDLRFAYSSALMLRFGTLRTAFQLRMASRAVFNVVDEAGAGVIETDGIQKALKMLGLDEVAEEDLQYVMNAFDDDGSGAIDQQEFNKMVLALCSSSGPGGIKAAVAAVCDPKKKVEATNIKLAEPPSPAVAEKRVEKSLDERAAEMTGDQLQNVLERLKMRLTNRDEDDRKKQLEREAAAAQEEAAKKEAERVRREAEQRHADEVEKRRRAEKEEAIAAAEAEAAALRIVGISLKEMLHQVNHTYTSDADIEALAPDMFKHVNTCGDGRMSFEELKQAVIDTDLQIQDNHLRMALDLFDHERKGGLDIANFTSMLKALLPSHGEDNQPVGPEGSKRLWRKLKVFTKAMPSIVGQQKSRGAEVALAVARTMS